MLLIRRSISNTKKLFQTTIQSVKSLFSTKITYQRLPKTPPFNPFTCVGCHDKSLSQTYREFDMFYSDYTTRWDREIDHNNHDNNNVVLLTSQEVEVEVEVENHKVEENIEKNEMEKRCLVTKKLKELEMVESSNLENVQDIEEVLYLYSYITCPVYVDIFDKFVMDMYTEIVNLKAVRKKIIISSTSRLHHSSFL